MGGAFEVLRAPVLDPDVDALLTWLAPARRADVDRLRALLLGVDAAIVEGVKWRSPSSRTSGWFATINLSAKDLIRVILHAGAKAWGLDLAAVIEDPEGVPQWLGPDRAMVMFDGPGAIEQRGPGLVNVGRAWINHF